MSIRELDRMKVVQAVVDGNLKPIRAAIRLGITARQVHRLVKRYREDGAAGLTSKKRGNPFTSTYSFDKVVHSKMIQIAKTAVET